MRAVVLFCAGAVVLAAGCSSAHYRKSADKQVYKIISQTESNQFGKASGFSIDTPYSKRNPRDVKAEEIVGDRLKDGQVFLTISDALALATTNSRTYQTRKEQLYLTALTLTRTRHEFRPQLSGTGTGTAQRNANGTRQDELASRLSLSQFFKTGARLGVAVANDVVSYYSGTPSRTAVSTLSVDLVQPLLRGAGTEAAAEDLTQGTRNVIYEVRSFDRFQTTFSVDVVNAYFRLLQRKDTVRNEYNTYLNLILSRERSEALSVDRLPKYQVDQAQQDELRAKVRYLQAIESYRDGLDSFKGTLGLPLGMDIKLDDGTVKELTDIGLPQLDLDERKGFSLAVAKRLDVINEIDRFEDSQRKIRVAANFLKPDLNVFARTSLDSQGVVDYTKFNLNDYKASAGVSLGLPFDRLAERNNYRTTFITFERQLRQLGITLDDLRDSVRQGIRSLELARQSYEIQKLSVALADRRVESATMLLQAGRAQIRDLLEAQSAQLQARNAFTAALFDYHSTRLTLLRDLGILDVGQEKFWLKDQALPKGVKPDVQESASTGQGAVITPEELFGK
ncbi:MAG TPA: TolC family protein [Roseimicrobium sp.]|nr:TolC family protein [Roseimicrobium sp.]